MTEALLELPAHIRKRMVSALKSGLLPIPCSSQTLQSVLGLRNTVDDLANALAGLSDQGFTGPSIAVLIEAVNHAAARTSGPDIVWSGPTVPGIHARDTRRVYDELLGSATRSVWLCTYAFFDGPKAFKVLARRMEEVPALKVRILLNVQRSKRDTTRPDDLVRRFADVFWESEWPGSNRPSVYYDPRSLELDGTGAVLHAKAVVSDDEAVFVTSANLTESALDRNIELGLLVRERTLALTVANHFQALIDRKVLHKLPVPHGD